MNTVSAFGYLIWRSFSNRVVSRIRRARNPRYVLGMVMAAVYMAYFWLRPLLLEAREPGSAVTAQLVSSIGQGIAVGLILVQALYWWVFGGNRTSLAFSPAEVAFLFPAPLSRRVLISYKVARLQFATAFSVLIGVMLFRRGSLTLPLPLRAIGLWLFLTIPALHSIGSAMVRASWAEHGVHGLRRQRVAIVAVAAVFTLLAIGILQRLPLLRSAFGDLPAFGSVITTVLTTGLLGAVLWPIRAAVAPMLSPTSAAWVRAMPAALAILALHVAWVLRSDAAFEEAALAASVARAARVERFKARRAGAPVPSSAKAAKGSLRLAAVGHPATAIVWKNILAFRRRSGYGTLIFLAAAPVGWGALASSWDESMPATAATAALVLTVVMAVFGPMLMRNDLRQDMRNIVALKVLPLGGRTIVTAEVLSVVVPIAVVQLILLGVATTAALIDPTIGVTPAQAIGLLAAGIPVIVAVEGTLVTIQNAAPVLFPAWTRLGMEATGMEGMGGRLVSFGIVLMLLAAMLLVPGGLAAALIYFGTTHAHYLVPAVGVALILGGAILGAELYGALGLLGDVLERTEPSEIG